MLLRAAVALSRASIEGSESGRGLICPLLRGCDSHARPAAFSVSPCLSRFGADRYFLKPLFSLRNVVRIVFLPWSGLGLLDTLVVGTGSVGGRPIGEGRIFCDVEALAVVSLLRAGLSGGRLSIAGVALGSSDICIGGTVSSPSHCGPGRSCNVSVSPLCFSRRRLPLRSCLSSLGVVLPTSWRLLLRVSSKSTRSLHCISNSFRESNRALSVSDLGA